MRVLLDTNILIHREAANVRRDDIGILFRWLDRIAAKKCIHPDSAAELRNHADAGVVATMQAKIASYHMLRTVARDTAEISDLRLADRTANDEIDTNILAEVAAGRVDALVTEDRGIHAKAASIGLGELVFTIDAFLEKVTAENPEFADYRVLAVKKVYFGNLNLQDSFFDSFRRDYPYFERWFARNSEEIAYACIDDHDAVVAFLYLKREGPDENYADIEPRFLPASRLKIGTFKVTANGFKLGERFLKIVFDNALLVGAREIYVTAFRSSPAHDRLIDFLQDWGFHIHGTKGRNQHQEVVLVRPFRPVADPANPMHSYPFASAASRKFIVPIYPAYHTELLPDSILTTESPEDFVENKPNRNAISKVYISRSIERGLHAGDLIVFYRTRSGNGPARYTSVATSLGVVQNVVTDIRDEDHFIQLCRKRSVFTDSELSTHWNHTPGNTPFVVNFLYLHSFPRRPNLEELLNERIISAPPRGFEPLSDEAFQKLMEISNADQRFVVN